MKKRRIWIAMVVLLLLAAGGGYFAYTRYFAITEEPEEQPALETTTAQRGDIIITADGSGELVPSAEVEMAFRTGGVVDEVVVQVGDMVQADDLLAQLKTDDLEKAEEDVLHVLSDVSCFGERGGICNGEGDFEDAGKCSRKKRLAYSGRSE